MHIAINRIIVLAFLAGIVFTIGIKLEWINYEIHSDFIAVEFAFTILLLSELAALIFVMPRSVGMAIGKQFEILSLILLRSAFKEFSHLEADFAWETFNNPVTKMIVDAFGSLLIFVMVGIYYKSLKRIRLTENEEEHQRFKAFKKFVALLLLFTFLTIGIIDLATFIQTKHYPGSFNTFYTVLIFCDILIVLIAMRYTLDFNKIFRYSAFVLATVLIRISLTAPPYISVLISVIAAVFVLLMNFSFNSFVELQKENSK